MMRRKFAANVFDLLRRPVYSRCKDRPIALCTGVILAVLMVVLSLVKIGDRFDVMSYLAMPCVPKRSQAQHKITDGFGRSRAYLGIHKHSPVDRP